MRDLAWDDQDLMRRRSRTLLCFAILLTGALTLGPAGSASATGCENRYAQPRKDNITKIEPAIRCLLNRERAKRGLAALKSSRSLREAAARHSRSMA